MVLCLRPGQLLVLLLLFVILFLRRGRVQQPQQQQNGEEPLCFLDEPKPLERDWGSLSAQVSSETDLQSHLGMGAPQTPITLLMTQDITVTSAISTTRPFRLTSAPGPRRRLETALTNLIFFTITGTEPVPTDAQFDNIIVRTNANSVFTSINYQGRGKCIVKNVEFETFGLCFQTAEASAVEITNCAIDNVATVGSPVSYFVCSLCPQINISRNTFNAKQNGVNGNSSFLYLICDGQSCTTLYVGDNTRTDDDTTIAGLFAQIVFQSGISDIETMSFVRNRSRNNQAANVRLQEPSQARIQNIGLLGNDLTFGKDPLNPATISPVPLLFFLQTAPGTVADAPVLYWGQNATVAPDGDIAATVVAVSDLPINQAGRSTELTMQELVVLPWAC